MPWSPVGIVKGQFPETLERYEKFLSLQCSVAALTPPFELQVPSASQLLGELGSSSYPPSDLALRAIFGVVRRIHDGVLPLLL